MSNQIYVVLPSNTPGYQDNAPNKFTVQLPKSLDLSSGNWVCGLHSISYVYSWHTLGTIESQWIRINFINGAHIKIPVPRMSFSTIEQLEKSLKTYILNEVEKHFSQRQKRDVEQPAKKKKRRKYVIKLRDGWEDSNRLKKKEETQTEENITPTFTEAIESDAEPIAEQVPCMDPETNEACSDEEETIEEKAGEEIVQEELPEYNAFKEKLPQLPEAEALHEALTPRDRLYQKITGHDRIKGSELATENAYFPPNFSNEEIRNYINSIHFKYDTDISKFKLIIDHSHIDYISLSPQLGYVLGFEKPIFVQNNETAKYAIDLKAGINSFGVYIRGVTENIICGNELVSLLRVVSISGAKFAHGDTIEKIYDSPMFLKVLPKNINSIEIELRTLGFDGRLLPFQYGNTIITLIFKKLINF